MNKIKIVTASLFYIGLCAVMVSCGKDEVEIVSQDTEWIMDNKYIEEDIREQLDIDPYNQFVYFGYASSPLIELNGTYNKTEVAIDGKGEIDIKVKISTVFKEDIAVSLVRDENRLKDCPVNVAQYGLITESNFETSPQVIKAGELETIFKVKLTDIAIFTEGPGYVLPLAIKLDGTYDHLKVAQVRSNVFIKLNISIVFDNIDSSNLPIEGTSFNKGTLFSSNKMSGSVGSFNDGSLSNEWYTSTNDAYVEMILPEKTLLKGIRIDTHASTYSLKKVRILVDNGEGYWLDNGVFDRETKGNLIYVKFKIPMECKKIRLDELTMFPGNRYIEINEITFIK